MRQKRYTDPCRREAIRQVTEKGPSVKDLAERTGCRPTAYTSGSGSRGRPMAPRRAVWRRKMTSI